MTIIAVLFMILGLGLLGFEIGVKKNLKKDLKKLLTGTIWLIGSLFVGIGANPASDMPNGSKEMVIFGSTLFIIGVIILSVKAKFKNKVYYIFPALTIIILIIFCVFKINNWNVRPSSRTTTGNGCYPSRPYYVCKDVKRKDGTTYKNCRCEARR